MGPELLDWIQLSQDRISWQASANAVIDPRIYKSRLLDSWATVHFPNISYAMELVCPGYLAGTD
jgi:hypothetical protein